MSTNEFEIRDIRLLLVEDNPADARVVERHLKDAGLNRVTSDWVQTAADAAQRLTTTEYDLVLLDLGLPDATGLQALRALRAIADLTPIIVLTGSDDYKQGLSAVREGAQDYLEKRRVNAGMLSRIVSYSVERNNFHRDLVRATRRYQDLFNNVPVALFTANSDGTLKTANAACQKLLSCQGIPLEKVNFLDMLFEPAKRAHFLDLISRQRMVEGWETTIQDSKGEKLHVLINTAPLYDSTQAFAGWEGCIADISMLKQTLEERDRLEDNLRQAQKLEAIGQLAAGIAHEINTPTQYVGDNLRFLKESFGELDAILAQLVLAGGAPASKLLSEADFAYLKEEIPRALNQSLEGVDRVAKIVRAMKEFSHPAREKTATDLNRAIQSTITVASNEWKYVAEIEMDLDANLPAVHCSPAEFNQVILNIVVNAAHAISDVVGDGGKGKGKITVRTRPDGEWAVIDIKDSGSGMPPHIQQRIFDPFFTTKEVGKGTGQGLAIAHNVIVDKHGGTIKVTSAPGAGTTFTIRLPIGGTKVEPEAAAGSSRLNAIRVIFVDDEPRVLEGLKRMLRPKRNEWQMTFVSSAQAALDALKVEPCEVVVTDMRMPGMNGAELLEVVQREYPDTIRLILSGQAETESVMKALGVSHQFLSKPCDAEILQGTISRAFALRDLAGSESVKALVARINKLPTLPATYQQLVETLRRPNSSIEDVSNVIATDPAMTARLLKLVNSAYFGLQKPVADVARAGALLGLDRIMALVLGQGIFSDCDPPNVPGFSMDALWSHSVTTATAAHRIAIAQQMDRDQVAAAFLAGMLHDIGKLVLAMGLPEAYGKVLSQVGARPGSLQQVEMLELHAAHTDVGAYLVGLWGLPNTIAEAIAYHEDPSQAPNQKFGLPGIVHVADRLAHRPDITDPRSPELGLNHEYLESQGLTARWSEWRDAFVAVSPAVNQKAAP